jgi:hypothetical protein
MTMSNPRDLNDDSDQGNPDLEHFFEYHGDRLFTHLKAIFHLRNLLREYMPDKYMKVVEEFEEFSDQSERIHGRLLKAFKHWAKSMKK